MKIGWALGFSKKGGGWRGDRFEHRI